MTNPAESTPPSLGGGEEAARLHETAYRDEARKVTVETADLKAVLAQIATLTTERDAWQRTAQASASKLFDTVAERDALKAENEAAWEAVREAWSEATFASEMEGLSLATNIANLITERDHFQSLSDRRGKALEVATEALNRIAAGRTTFTSATAQAAIDAAALLNEGE